MTWFNIFFQFAPYVIAVENYIADLQRRIVTRLFEWSLNWYHPRTMMLLRNGQWIHHNPSKPIPNENIRFVYSARKNTITPPGVPKGTRLKRFPWLSVMENSSGRDMTDFFVDLRVTETAPQVHEILALFSHQKGWMPSGKLTVTTRMGDNIQIEEARFMSSGFTGMTPAFGSLQQQQQQQQTPRWVPHATSHMTPHLSPMSPALGPPAHAGDDIPLLGGL